jgi:hypothetical protein
MTSHSARDWKDPACSHRASGTWASSFPGGGSNSTQPIARRRPVRCGVITRARCACREPTPCHERAHRHEAWRAAPLSGRPRVSLK